MIAVALTVALALQKPGPPPASADTAGGGASRPCEVAIDNMGRAQTRPGTGAGGTGM